MSSPQGACAWGNGSTPEPTDWKYESVTAPV
jgi:hypothetical protein